MPLTRQEVEEIMQQVDNHADKAVNYTRETLVITAGLVRLLLEKYEEMDAKTVMIDNPKLTVERVKGMIGDNIKDAQDDIKEEKDYIIIQCMKYGIATLRELLKEINEADDAQVHTGLDSGIVNPPKTYFIGVDKIVEIVNPKINEAENDKQTD